MIFTIINDFQMFFFIVFDHVNACASMHSLVKIHNSLQLLAQSRQKQSRNRCSHCNCISHLKHYLIRSHHVVNGLDNFGHLNQINNTIAINIVHPEKIYSHDPNIDCCVFQPAHRLLVKVSFFTFLTSFPVKIKRL